MKSSIRIHRHYLVLFAYLVALYIICMKVIDYMKDVRAELKHVSWPTRKQVAYFTILVIVLSLVTAYFLGLLDFAFTKGLGLFIGE